MGAYVAGGGEFNRDTSYITTRITADGRDGYPVEPDRYRLIVARACPWANRTIIVRRLLGLEDVLSIGFCGPTHDEESWTFDLDPGGVDPVLKIPRLKDAYLKRLRRIEGQARGLQRMVEEEQYCIDILTQVSAMTKALQSVALGLLDEHLSHCVVDAAREGGREADVKVKEASDAIARLVRS